MGSVSVNPPKTPVTKGSKGVVAMNEERFQIDVENVRRANPCFEVFALTFESTKKAATALRAAWSAFAGRHGPSLTVYLLNDSNRWRKVKSQKDLDMIPFWTADKETLAQPLLGIQYQAGNKDTLAPPGFEFYFDQSSKDAPVGMVRFALAPSEGSDFNAIWPLISDSLAEFPLAWGYASYGFLWESGTYYEEEIREVMNPLLLRHPGMSLGEPLKWLVNGRGGLLTVGWLTMLGPTFLENLGGLKALKEAVKGTSLSVYPLGDDKVVLRAGETPQAGDVNRGDWLAPYREAGRVLSQAQASDHLLSKMWLEEMPRERAQSWLRRFFEDPT